MFDSVDTARLCLEVFAAMVPQMVVNRDKMHSAANRGYSTATDLADYLVSKNVPFRDAHEVVGKVVSFALEKDLGLAQLDLADLEKFSPAIERDVYKILTLEGSVNARNHVGGTAPDQVILAAKRALQLLDTRET